MSESTNKTNILEILISPFVIILNIIKYTWIGLKYVGFDLWVDLYNSASYKVDRTYQTTKQAFVTQEEKIYERTKKKVRKSI